MAKSSITSTAMSSLHRRPALEDDLRIRRIHPVTPCVGVPGDEVPPGDPAHDIVRPGDDAGECGPCSLPIPGGKFGIEDESFVTGGQFSDLAQQPAAVRPADGIQHLAQLAPAKLTLIGLIRARTTSVSRRTHDPAPGKRQQLLLRVRLEFDPWHLNFTRIDT
jgi:hypothetical protein